LILHEYRLQYQSTRFTLSIISGAKTRFEAARCIGWAALLA